MKLQKKVIVLFLLIPLADVGLADELTSSFNKLKSKIERRHQTATTAVVSVRRNKNLEKLFNTTNRVEATKAVKKIEKMSIATYRKYKMDEMCIINNKGHEVARIVNDKIAPPEDLSHEEASAPFFAPTLNLKDREVHVSDPYMSPDSKRWVLSYSTPVVNKDGSKPALVHYEKYWGLYGNDLKNKLPKSQYVNVIDKQGFVWFDSRKEIKLDSKKDSENPKDYFAQISKAYLAAISREEGEATVELEGKKTHRIIYGRFPKTNLTLILGSEE